MFFRHIVALIGVLVVAVSVAAVTDVSSHSD